MIPNLLQPFLDYENGIAIAHNGTIVNFYSLLDEMGEQNQLSTAASKLSQTQL